MSQPVAFRMPYLAMIEEARVMPKRFGVDMTAHIAAQIDAQEVKNVAKAEWTVLHNGKLLPVTNLYDSDGNDIFNPMHARTVVAYDASRPDKRWITITKIDPGDIWRLHDGNLG